MTELTVPRQDKTEEESELKRKRSELSDKAELYSTGGYIVPSKKQEMLGIHGTITVTRTVSALSAAGNASCLAFIIS